MKIYNDLTSRKEEFVPSSETTKIYVCGVTPYDDCHLGHAMSYIFFDAMRRYLEFRGYRVRYVQNFTDIDDKIINRANRLGKPPSELANDFIRRYFEDTDALNIRRADVYPKATEEIPKIQEVIAGLMQKGHAYTGQDGVYFRVKSFPGYGALSHRSLEDMKSEAGEGTGKEHPMDFALWKFSKPGEPLWESPWGNGRPGWHIECTAMSLKYLGATLDIHGGGQDLVFPHHENEIAQSEAYTAEKPFARFWMHNGMLQLGEEKMSKSLGNLVTIRQALQNSSSDAIRLFVLSSHYRNPLTYTPEAIAASARGAERLAEAVAQAVAQGVAQASPPVSTPVPQATVPVSPGAPPVPQGMAEGVAQASPPVREASINLDSYRQRFIQGGDDDFNFAQGIAAMFDLAKDINRGREAGHDVGQAQGTLRELAGVLGLSLEAPKETRPAEAAPFIDLLLSVRQDLRAQKQFALADKVRAGLTVLGVVIEDTPKGPRWKYEKRG
ncbi:MAG: cysteine--tRNA ligase [Chloroflexi bacterium]|nr:cysteine--tRNA ligase [Chloroflexota bacterium]